MRVLKRGNIQKPKWSTEIWCKGSDQGRGCGALLLVEKEDLFTQQVFIEELGDEYDKIFIECPECGGKTRLEVPGWFEDSVWLLNLPSYKKYKARKWEILEVDG